MSGCRGDLTPSTHPISEQDRWAVVCVVIALEAKGSIGAETALYAFTDGDLCARLEIR
jgi:hypothetical protein